LQSLHFYLWPDFGVSDSILDHIDHIVAGPSQYGKFKFAGVY
jgi:hypothetical protein